MINFSKVFLKQKKTLIFITVAGIVLLFTPFYEAKATIWDDVVGGLSQVANTIAGIPLYFAIWPLLIAALVGPVIVGVIFSINLWLLRFAAQGNIITLPLTHNGLVDKGVAATTGLVNLAFILVLVIIALATILRRENYGLKKLLPKFIFILLLINFVPVICGAVIDIANILTKAFLDFDIPKVFGSVFSTPLTQDFNNIRDAIAGQKSWTATLLDELQQSFSFSGIIGKIAIGFSAIFFGLFASLIFFLYFILFLLRYIIIWFLVILAPIAWFCQILPTTQKLFKTWLNYFIQWAFVGAIAGFFLKLGAIAAATLNGNININTAGIDPGAWYIEFFRPIFNIFNSLALSGAITVFLLIGFVQTLKFSGGGTESILKWGEKVPGMLANTRLGKKTLGRLASGTQKTLAGISESSTRFGQWSKNMPGFGGKILRGISTPTKGAAIGLNRLAGPGLIKYADEARKVPEKELKAIDGMTPAAAEEYIKTKPMFGDDRLQYEAKMADSGTLEYTGLKDDAITRARSILAAENPYYQKEAMAVAKNFPELFNGHEGADAYIATKTIGKDKVKDKAKRDEATKEAWEEIHKAENETVRRLANDDATTIEVGLKLNYITKDDVEKDRTTALAKAKTHVTAQEITSFINDNIANAATAVFVKELKPEDIKKMADPSNTVGKRIGLTLGDPKNMQKIQDNFGRKKLDATIKNAGGLDSATNTFDKLDEYITKVNPAMGSSILTSPAYQEMEIAARKYMRDIDKKITTSFAAYEKGLKIKEEFKSNAPLEAFYNKIRIQEKLVEGFGKQLATAQRNKLQTEITRLKTEINKAQNTIDIEEAGLTTKEKDAWEKVKILRGGQKGGQRGTR